MTTEPPFILYENGESVEFAAGAAAEITVDSNGVHVKTSTMAYTEPLGEDLLSQVRIALKRIEDTAELPTTEWRAFGWAAFELAYALNGLPIPQNAGTLFYLFFPRDEATLRAGTAELRVCNEAVGTHWEDALQTSATGLDATRLDVDETTDTTGYREAAANTISDIDGVHLQKVILSRTVGLSQEIDLVETFRTLRKHNTPARSFLFQAGGIASAGVSPGTLVEVSADGEVSARPLAGTRARTGDSSADARLREELRSDPKEIYEHAVSVNLALDEVAEVSVPDKTVVKDFMRLVERGSVCHLSSEVRGKLRPDLDALSAFESLFPAVTTSGVPKYLACEQIGRRESSPRGIYGGAVLSLQHNGALDAAVVLRSVYQKGGEAWLRAGAGLISQSDPDRELEETREKLRSVSRHLVPKRSLQ